MSQAEVIKQCKIKTKIVKRLHKELDYYKKEQEREQARVDKMREEGADLHGMKQAETVLQESIMMVPQTLQRLETAFEDLSAYVQENEQDISESEELKAAKELIEAVKATI
ncbi:hypothetical protein CEUSTIGMA_g1675.t1 [Chlamydomonas eustigma]|uniref:Tubulin-specific chaperone A n=1 Tax=Chlamydomonas eustigma TaxID=1157962 RepID=A0A250WU00_9CHLO|nr:hypothetical protein CEUSTIGMA_g1675.t1 [Chlamydomonas eustigma]|eukprot:GAX74226.1 hypothetical protein CEUSTIGMA_g1675.t1 [Chlamydomonas eustigma]